MAASLCTKPLIIIDGVRVENRDEDRKLIATEAARAGRYEQEAGICADYNVRAN